MNPIVHRLSCRMVTTLLIVASFRLDGHKCANAQYSRTALMLNRFMDQTLESSAPARASREELLRYGLL